MSEKIFRKKVLDKEKNEKFVKIIRKSKIAYLLNTFSNLFLLLF